MDIRHLNYFLEVARQKSFSKASEKLHISQPTISKMIKDMEEEWGVLLFERLSKGIQLTDAGEIVYKQAQKVVEAFENLMHPLEDLVNFKKGTIKIGLPPMIGSNFFPAILGKFQAQYPGISIHLVEEGSIKVEEKVMSGELDVGVALSPVQKDVFHTFTFVKEELRLVVHNGHRFAGKTKVALGELKDESIILFREDFALHDRIIQECIRSGFKPHIMYRSSQWDFISEMVAEGLGVAFLPEPICRNIRSKNVQVIKLVKPTIPWHLTMIWKKDKYLSFAAREWLKFTKELLSGRLAD
ncbi:LysR family transcriptional regulator [Fictibacillus sp. Mic-4]|uniref:cidABC operon transcriptional activator CidR n=1 Tax=Fictibacillus TaxID=1329200 RepID=UPI0003F6864E|nr:LysR family transcriptional regulator [Fictibacillus gelatini]